MELSRQRGVRISCEPTLHAIVCCAALSGYDLTMRPPLKTLLLFLWVWGGSRAGAQSSAETNARAASPPSLVVLISIDQMRDDYLDRFGSQLPGGLARIARGGAWF